jgi:hypothetical protein
LPQRVFAALVAFDGYALRDDIAGEQALDVAPSAGKIRILPRQSHNDMEMIGKDNDCVDRERTSTSDFAKCGAQACDLLDENFRSPVGESDSEEKCSARNEISPVVHHG